MLRMTTKWQYRIACAAMLLPAACSPIGAVTPSASAALPPIAAPVTASNQAGNGTPAALPVPSSAAPLPSAGPVALQVLTPSDGALVTSQQIQLAGTASPGAIVTVNDEILIVGVDGGFQTTITLLEGPNLIEVVASNDSGSESAVELVVIYAP